MSSWPTSLAAKRVEVAIVTFGPVSVAADFQTVDVFQPPHLIGGGRSSRASSCCIRGKKPTRAAGIPYYRPWVFLITDGAPTDAWSQAAQAVHDW